MRPNPSEVPSNNGQDRHDYEHDESSLTARQALVDHAHLAAGQRVLIHGGTGGVGAFAIQLAHALGAEVLTTTSAPHVELAHALGADAVIDYAAHRFGGYFLTGMLPFLDAGAPTRLVPGETAGLPVGMTLPSISHR